MVKSLANQPKLHGISKSKIMVLLGVILVILLVAITIGMLDESSSDTDSNSEPLITSGNYTNKQNNINQILDKVEQNKKIIADKQESIIIAPIVPIVNPKPDIIEDNPVVKKTKEEKYASVRAKSLMFVKNNNVDSSTPIAKSQESSRTGNNSTTENKKNSDTYDTVIKPSTSPYEVKAGSVIPSIMINGINSDLSGIVTAMVRQNVYDSVSRKYLLIPQGAKLIGKYDSNVIYGQERLLVAWTRLIYPNGDSVDLDAIPGSDIAGFSGFSDQVDNKYWKIFGSSFIMGVITASMQYSQNNTNPNVQVGGIGISNPDPTFGQTVAGSLGQQLGQTGMMITQKNLNVKPTIIIRAHYPFNIILAADLALKPYK